MKIPKKLRIGGHIFKVICPYQYNERGDRAADYDHTMKEIHIDDKDAWSHKKKHESGIAVTFLHEILHACDYMTGQHIFDGAEGEKKIEGLSESLFQILRDNDLDFRDKGG